MPIPGPQKEINLALCYFVFSERRGFRWFTVKDVRLYGRLLCRCLWNRCALYCFYAVYWYVVLSSGEIKVFGNAGRPISKLLEFYLGEVRLGVNNSRSEVEVLDDVSAQLTVYNVSRDMSGSHVTCLVTGYDFDHVVSSDVYLRVAGTLHIRIRYRLVSAAAAAAAAKTTHYCMQIGGSSKWRSPPPHTLWQPKNFFGSKNETN